MLNRVKINNKGISLVEVVITMGIVSIIMSSLFFFISVGSNAVKNSTIDADLQINSQSVCNQIQKEIMQAKTIGVMSMDNGSLYDHITAPAGLIDIKVLYIDNQLFIFDSTTKIIYFAKRLTSNLITLTTEELAPMMTDNNILSKDISQFKISLDKLQSSKYVQLYIKFQHGNNQIETNTKIKVRNFK